MFPDAYDRNATEQRPPTSSELNLLAAHRQEQLSDDGSSADENVPGKGSGWTGVGSPLQVGNGYTARDYCDGQGLPSPGRWPVQNRRYPSTERWKKVMAKFAEFVEARCKPDLLMALAMGRVETCPVDPGEIAELKGSIIASLASDGLGLGRRPGDREDIPIDFRFLGLLLTAADDPEVGLGNFAQGVRVGPGTRMPRLPALYRPKRKWRLASQTDPRAYLDEEGHEGESCWRRNYATLLPLTKEVVDVLMDQTERGQVIRLSEEEAKLRFPWLVVASLGASRKDRPNGEVTARVLHDGTNGLSVNTRTRLRDQERSPISSDIKRAMREKASRGLSTFELTADVKEAHRQIPIDPRDWHLLGCQVERGADVFVNTVGTFGITSASYYWSRVSSAVGRLAQYLASDQAETWHMLVADDFHLEAGGAHYRLALMVFFVLCSTVGVPLSWHKTAGGDTVVWVGFELLHRTRHLGISQRRAEWFVRWAPETANADYIHLARFEEGLGRIMFVAGALELERPFLGPLYKFMVLRPRDSVRRVPSFVSFILHFLADRVAATRHYNCSEILESTEEAPRVDAQSSDVRTGIGGWFPRRDKNGVIDTKLSPWFSLVITPEEWPWVFAKSRKASLIISTLEALAVLVALKLRYGEEPGRSKERVRIAPTLTDNRGNGAALNKLMTTKFPASALLMELACYMKKMSIRPVVEWIPREGNKEADRLANGDHSSFRPDLRIPVRADSLCWIVLAEALAAGQKAESRFQEAKASGRLPNRAMRKRKRRVEERLKATDPW